MKRFWDKVDKSGDCWEWVAGKSRSGYGKFWFENRTLRPHRFAWELTYGKISKGLFVLHRCDNRSCVNPEHLFLGTHQDNMDDMVTKGRHTVQSGSDHYKSKLTEKLVTEARILYSEKDWTYTGLAKKYCVDPSTMRYAIIGRNWGKL